MAVRSLIAVSALFVLVSIAAAEEPPVLKVEDMAFCTGIGDRVPVGAEKTFPATVGRIYCFTRITGATDATAVSHVWYYDDEEKARVTLPVRSRSWRTWSSKLILESWTGRWRVDVLTADGKLLRSSEFLVETEGAQE